MSVYLKKVPMYDRVKMLRDQMLDRAHDAKKRQDELLQIHGGSGAKLVASERDHVEYSCATAAESFYTNAYRSLDDIIRDEDDRQKEELEDMYKTQLREKREKGEAV